MVISFDLVRFVRFDHVYRAFKLSHDYIVLIKIRIIMNDSEFTYNSDEDVAESHSQLVDAVAQLDKAHKIKKAERTEPTLEVSEFHLVKSGVTDTDIVSLQKLIKPLDKKGFLGEISRRVKIAQEKSKVLSKPLEKPAAERIKRLVGFQNTKTELGKWNAVITKNRATDGIQFPLDNSSIKLEPTEKYLKRFRLKSELEKELAKLEPEKENAVQKEDEFKMTLREVIERRKEAARIRAQQSYKEARANRQKKIKSKTFHRIQRKEKIKQQLKQFEDLQKTDPEAALEKLEQLDKNRALERMSLRHKSTGQWAKNKQIRAKYDTETRKVLSQQLSISRDLTQKISKPDDSDDDGAIEEDTSLLANSKGNPWVNNTKSELEINDFISSYRKYWDKQQQNTEKQTKNVHEEDNANTTSTKTNSTPNFKEPLKIGTSNVKDAVKNENNKEKSNVFITPGDSNVISNSKKTFEGKKKLILPSNTLKNEVKTCVNGTSKSHSKITRDHSKESISNNIISTCAWNVATVEIDKCKLDVETSHIEKLNKLFDDMEDKIQDKVQSKLERIKRKISSSKVPKKRKPNKRSDDEDVFDGLEFKEQRQRPILDEPMLESVGNENFPQSTGVTIHQATANTTSVVNKAEIDPNKFVNVKPKHLKTHLPDIITGGNEALDESENEEEKHMIISEAFADDDVVEDFRKEKDKETKESQPEDIDLSMPGWGCWGGRNIRQSTRKKKRLIIKFPKEDRRKDENKGDVIIFEENDAKIRKHQVSELPYPFKSVKDFEASIRAPVSRSFIPENAHMRLIQPVVKTAMGKVIEPMDESILLKTNNGKNRGPGIPKKATKKSRMPRKDVKKQKNKPQSSELKLIS